MWTRVASGRRFQAGELAEDFLGPDASREHAYVGKLASLRAAPPARFRRANAIGLTIASVAREPRMRAIELAT